MRSQARDLTEPPRRAKTLGTPSTRSAMRCRRHFLSYFGDGLRDETYEAWERDYKVEAHARWMEQLGPRELDRLVRRRAYDEIASRAVAIEAKTNLLFSFEKMALRDAIRTPHGARTFAVGLRAFLHGAGDPRARFTAWCQAVGALPRRQTRVLTWPIVTVFGFLARPQEHFFLKPNVTKRAAARYGFDLVYTSKPCWETYASVLAFADVVRRDLSDLRPRDMIDLQSFVWVTGSDEEYPW
jgi:hypothetical protein